MKTSLEILETIINVTGLTNKWSKWSEEKLPQNDVFTPSIFQLRDAYSHLIKLFSDGFLGNKYSKPLLFTANSDSDFNSLFMQDYAKRQLQDVLSHTNRAFFDVADYILYSLSLFFRQRQDINDFDSRLNYATFNLKIENCRNEIDTIKFAKSEDYSEAFTIIEKWDKLLTIITTIYSFDGLNDELMRKYNILVKKIKKIEVQHKPDIIKDHDPDFFKNITLIEDAYKKCYNNYIKVLDNFIKDNTVILDPAQWQNEAKNEISSTINKFDEMYDSLDSFEKAVKITSTIVNGKTNMSKIKKYVFAIITFLLSTILTELITKNLFNNNVTPTSTGLPTSYLNYNTIAIIVIFGLLCVFIFSIIYAFNFMIIRIKK